LLPDALVQYGEGAIGFDQVAGPRLRSRIDPVTYELANKLQSNPIPPEVDRQRIFPRDHAARLRSRRSRGASQDLAFSDAPDLDVGVVVRAEPWRFPALRRMRTSCPRPPPDCGADEPHAPARGSIMPAAGTHSLAAVSVRIATASIFSTGVIPRPHFIPGGRSGPIHRAAEKKLQKN
jgi:hypothetical protein